jgi:hypothetical protein
MVKVIGGLITDGAAMSSRHNAPAPSAQRLRRAFSGRRGRGVRFGAGLRVPPGRAFFGARFVLLLAMSGVIAQRAALGHRLARATSLPRHASYGQKLSGPNAPDMTVGSGVAPGQKLSHADHPSARTAPKAPGERRPVPAGWRFATRAHRSELTRIWLP